MFIRPLSTVLPCFDALSSRCMAPSSGYIMDMDSSENNTFHIVYSPRFPLQASLKLTFGIGTSDQRFVYCSLTMNIEYCGAPGEPRWPFNSAVSWVAVVLSFYNTIWERTQKCLSDSLLFHRQLFLWNMDVVCPSWWYADITLDTLFLYTAESLTNFIGYFKKP